MEETLQSNKEDNSPVISKDTDQESKSTQLPAEEHEPNGSKIQQEQSSVLDTKSVLENDSENPEKSESKSNENNIPKEIEPHKPAVNSENVTIDVEDNTKVNEENVREENISIRIQETEESSTNCNSKSDSPIKSDDKSQMYQPSGIGNSLGLSLLAAEYATSEESGEDSTDFDGDNSDENDDDDDDDSSSSSCTDSGHEMEQQNSDQNNQIRSADDDLEKIATEIEMITNPQAYRQVIDIDSDTSSSDSDIEIIGVMKADSNLITIDEDDDDDENDDNKKNKKRSGPIRTKGEFLLEDLPPIEDLHITVPENECAELGKIHSIVDQLVLVNSIPGTVPFDLDTVLFLDKGKKVLGKVFDVLGQVQEPLYCVRFNSNKQIKQSGIEIGQTVYVAPKTEYSQFIILPNLMRIRGSDASWENDVEPPTHHLDYSDDEQERNARRTLRNRNKENTGDDDDDENGSGNESRRDSDNESIRSESTIVSRPRRKRSYQQQRYNSSNTRMNNSNHNRFPNGNQYPQQQQQQQYQQQQQQQYNQRFNTPNQPLPNNYPFPPYNFNQSNFPNGPQFSNGYPNPNLNQNFNRNPPPFNYNPNYDSWHSNFHPYNNGIPFQPQQQQQQQFNGGGDYWNYQNQSANVNMPISFRPPSMQQSQQPLYPAPPLLPIQNQSGYRQPPPTN